MSVTVLIVACFLIAPSLSISRAEQPGKLDALSYKIGRFMNNRPGAVVVMNVSSKEILAQWNLEIAARRVEPPGSAIKPFILRELLDLGRIRPEQKLLCRRPLYIGNKRMDCTHSPAVSALDAAAALAYSCNSYFATVTAQLSALEQESLLRRAGFSSPTGLVPNEAVGKIIPAANIEQLKLQTLGAWGIEVTPLELLLAARNLALQKQENQIGPAKAVFDGLEGSIQFGMAHAAQPQETTAAGKTGTSAAPHDPYTHGFFWGYAPADKPEIALVVYLEHGRGSDAAAIAGPVITAYWQFEHGGKKE